MGNYNTWYEFKKDLEKESGRRILNSDWLSVKPAAALPWDRSLLRSSLDTLARLNRRRRAGRSQIARTTG